MWRIALFLFLVALCIFVRIMIRDARTLWSGISFFWMMLCLAVLMLCMLSEYGAWLAEHDLWTGVLVILFLLAAGCMLLFPAALTITFFIEGIKVIRHEGARPSNLLSMLFSILLFLYLAVWPAFGSLEKNLLGTKLYVLVSISAFYLLSLMAVYSLSAVLNLIHFKKRRNADYIVVLGAGLLGDRVTPLLGAWIEKGMELLALNPAAKLVMSGGQGPGEDVAEGEAMAAYAAKKGVDAERIIVERESRSTEENLLFSRRLMEGEKPRVMIVTTAYHVFRALILARQQGMKCVGFGAKTKWYFTLNAMIREFVGYLSLTWKRHAVVMLVFAGGLAVVMG